ncbi:MAG: kelch repeat-containing protein [Planctomycetota bacterium]
MGPVAAQVGWRKLRESEFRSARARASHVVAFHGSAGLLVLGGQATPTPWLPDALWWTSAFGWNGGPGAPPPERSGHAVAEVGASQDLVVFGGRTTTAARLDETWTYDGSWQELAPAARPSARDDHAMAATTGNRVVLFGGRAANVLGDTWIWNGSTWSAAAPSTAPAARHGHAMAYDRARGVTVLFGGRDATGTVLDDTWEWDGSQWTRILPALAPAGRSGHGMAFDEVRGGIVLFGGETTTGPNAETWTWDGGQWTQPSPTSTPPATRDHAIAFDRNLQSVVVHGGSDGTWRYGDLWAWDGSVWDRVAHVTPDRRSSPAIAFDTQRQLLWLVSGTSEFSSGVYAQLADFWAWDGSTWAERPVGGNQPVFWGGKGAYDAARDRFVTIAGAGTPETWEWNGSAWTSRPTPELGSLQHSLVYHGGRGTVLAVAGGPTPAVREWNGSGWALVPTTGTGPRAHVPAVAYDSHRDRLVAVGPSLLEWDGSQWQTTSGPVPFVNLHPYYYYSYPFSDDELVYDPARRVLIAVTGIDGTDQETWEWDGADWAQHPYGGPDSFAGYRLAYDTVNQTVLQIGAARQAYGGSNDATLWSYGGGVGTYTSFGTGCPGGSGVPQLQAGYLPTAGGPFEVRLLKPFGAPGAVIFGLSDSSWGAATLPLELSLIGSPGCHLWVSPDVVVPVSSAFGIGSVIVPNLVPALAGGVFFNQGVVLDPTAGVITTAGWRAVVGC